MVEKPRRRRETKPNRYRDQFTLVDMPDGDYAVDRDGNLKRIAQTEEIQWLN